MSSNNAPQPGQYELGPRISPNIQQVAGLILRQIKELQRSASHLGLDINHPRAVKAETQVSGNVLG